MSQTDAKVDAAVAPQLVELAQRIVAEANRQGASAAECVIREGRELSVTMRLGEIESLTQAAGKSLGIRAFRGQQAGVTYSSDLSWPAVERMVSSALAIAENASPDPDAGLPAAGDLGQVDAELSLYRQATAEVTTEEAIEWARRTERAALDSDPRFTNSGGASCDVTVSSKVLANTLGFTGAVRRSSCSLSAVPIATENGSMQRDGWHSIALEPKEMETPEQVGRTAAQRTLRRLGARKGPTARVPVVYEQRAAGTLLEHILSAVNGDAIYGHASFLAVKLGKEIAHSSITVVDDGRKPGALGSAPFDGEGVRTRRTAVITKGRLDSYLLNSYSARKLGLRTTGNAARGLAGMPGVSCGNLWLEAGTQTPEEIIGGIKNGLYVTGFIGYGVNPVTGDYSRGAYGVWIENGELTYPVEEITVAGNLNEMLHNITAVGNDLRFRTAISSPTLLVEGLTVAGA